MSVIGDDNATLYSAEGQQSIAAVTVHSQATVKASNKNSDDGSAETEPSKKQANGWRKLKKLVGVKTSDEPGVITGNRAHAKSMDVSSERSSKATGVLWSGYAMRKRVLSADVVNNPRFQTTRSRSGDDGESSISTRLTSQLDLAIRGRFDGMDVLSLGPASRSSLPHIDPEPQQPITPSKRTAKTTIPTPSKKTKKRDGEEDTEINLDPLQLSFTGIPITCTSAGMVSNMISTSAGKDQTELILEGFIPGGGDRWRVKLEEPKGLPDDASIQTPSRKSSTDDDESTAGLTEDGSTNFPAPKLWDHIWGDGAPPPLPSHMQAGGNSEQDNVLQLAAACSVPIDLDEDTFIIDSPDHLRSVHDLAMIPLQVSKMERLMARTFCNLDLIHAGCRDDGLIPLYPSSTSS
jgi:hypothetical protein